MPKVATCASIMMNTTRWAAIPWVFLLVGAIGPDRMHAATAATSSQISQSWAPACASLHPASLWWGEAPSTQVFFLLSRVTTAACSVMHYEQMASLSLFPPVPCERSSPLCFCKSNNPAHLSYALSHNRMDHDQWGRLLGKDTPSCQQQVHDKTMQYTSPSGLSGNGNAKAVDLPGTTFSFLLSHARMGIGGCKGNGNVCRKA